MKTVIIIDLFRIQNCDYNLTLTFNNLNLKDYAWTKNIALNFFPVNLQIKLIFFNINLLLITQQNSYILYALVHQNQGQFRK